MLSSIHKGALTMTGTQQVGTDDVLLTRKEASTELLRLGIRRSPATLAKIFCTRSDGPPCRHLGRTPYYSRRDLHAWAMAQLTEKRCSSSEPRRPAVWETNAPAAGPAFKPTKPESQAELKF
jgi:hypothetical protein